jgi:hypothetical protein
MIYPPWIKLLPAAATFTRHAKGIACVEHMLVRAEQVFLSRWRLKKKKLSSNLQPFCKKKWSEFFLDKHLFNAVSLRQGARRGSNPRRPRALKKKEWSENLKQASHKSMPGSTQRLPNCVPLSSNQVPRNLLFLISQTMFFELPTISAFFAM